MIFDGKAFANEIEKQVKDRVAKMEKKPKIVSILVGDDPASELYTRLKRAAAGRCGIDFEVMRLEKWNEAVAKKLGESAKVTGLMVQMPVPGMSREKQSDVLSAIPLNKDIDGLRWQESGVMPATVRAILSILEKIETNWRDKFVVVGGTGSIGKPLGHFLKLGYGVEAVVANSKTRDLASVTRTADVLVSCVGREGIITGEMVRQGAVTVDVGAPKGDMTSEVYLKARIATPVPGGVGPVTVATLLQNAVDMVQSQG